MIMVLLFFIALSISTTQIASHAALWWQRKVQTCSSGSIFSLTFTPLTVLPVSEGGVDNMLCMYQRLCLVCCGFHCWSLSFLLGSNRKLDGSGISSANLIFGLCELYVSDINLFMQHLGYSIVQNNILTCRLDQITNPMISERAMSETWMIIVFFSF